MLSPTLLPLLLADLNCGPRQLQQTVAADKNSDRGPIGLDLETLGQLINVFNNIGCHYFSF